VQFVVTDPLRRILLYYHRAVFYQAAVEAGALSDHVSIDDANVA
jgi:hypothetical protein